MPQQVYALDFVHDRLANGRKMRILNIIDEFNSKAVNMYVDLRINSRKVIDVLKQISYRLRFGVMMDENLGVTTLKNGVLKIMYYGNSFNQESQCRMVIVKGLMEHLGMSY